MAFGFFKKQQPKADKVFFHGHIYTQDTGLPWAEAVAVKDGEIMAVGHYEEMDAILSDETERIDLNDRYLLPGFIDIHRSPVMKMMEAHYQEPPEELEETEDRNPFDIKNIYAMDLEADQMEEEELEQAETEEEAAREAAKAVAEAAVSEEDAEEAEDPEEELIGEEEAIEFAIEGEEEFSEEEVYYLDTTEFDSHVREALEGLADHGVTTVLDLKTPASLEDEFITSLIMECTEGRPKVRFFGSLYVNIPADPRQVQAILNKRRTQVTEVGDHIRNEVLYLELDSGATNRAPFSEGALQAIMEAASDRGYILFIEAVTHEDLLMAYRAVDVVRNQGYKNNILIASDEELSEEESSLLSSDGTVYTTWATNIDAPGFFDGNMEDVEAAIEHLTVFAAEVLGMEDRLGSIEKGKYADFAIFEENPLDGGVRELSRMSAVMTVIGGEIVHDVDNENDMFMYDMLMHQQF